MIATAAAMLLAACTQGGSAATGSAVKPTSTPAGSAASAVVTVPPQSSGVGTSAPATGSAAQTGAGLTTLPPVTTVLTTPPSTTVPKPVIIPAATVTASPALGSTGLSPRTAISFRAANGTLSAVRIANAEGQAVTGSLSADGVSWKSSEPLGYDKTYTVTGNAVGRNGKTVALSGSYSTAVPDDTVRATISPGDGVTVGIGAPILISLGTDITDTVGRANIEKAITVATVPKTEGAFAWIQHDDGWGLDWRPKVYWAPGTKVTVTADLYGVNYGKNLWGLEDVTSKFTIGRSEITKGDINTKHLKVYRDGKLLFDFPTSFGLTSDPGRVTKGGTYIVMSKEYLHLMSNPAYHYFNFKAYYAVRISNDGEFIHANDGTSDVQGYENVTHGCANLTTENAKAFYDQTMYGDPVEITGSSIPLSQSDGDIYDWAIPWSQWKTMSATSGAGNG